MRIRVHYLLLFPILLFSGSLWAEFSYVTTHPFAVIQHPQGGTPPTTFSRKIQALKAYDGSLYAGYGDWFANTGPSEMCRLTPPATSFVCEFTFWDEMAIIFRPLNNKLYAVGKDPHGPNNHAYAVKSGSSWSAKGAYSLGTLPVIHPFDMAAFAGSLWFFGDQWDASTQKQYPAALRSTNGGSSWSSSLILPQWGSPASAFGFSIAYNGKLYTQATSLFGSSRESFSRIFNGSSWTTGPNMLPFGSGRKTNVFNGKVAMIQNGSLTSFNGTSTSYASNVAVLDYTVSGGFIYILRETDHKVYRNDKLSTSGWRLLDQAPLNSISIEVLNGVLYAGTTNSQIHKSDVDPFMDIDPTIVPVYYLLLMDD